MNYEVVRLEAKKAVGISSRTGNNDPQMGMIIGGMWQDFFVKGIYAGVPGKINDKTLGMYRDYRGADHQEYEAAVACEVDGVAAVPEGLKIWTIPAGKYAKFIVQGHMQEAIQEFWTKLWAMDLPRAYGCDFEEYQNTDIENAEIHIYIGLTEE